MTTTYLAHAALEHLGQAQAALNKHVAAGPDGRCLTCREEQPCSALRLASATFQRYGRLPARSPGLASRGVRQAEGFAWFDGTEVAADVP